MDVDLRLQKVFFLNCVEHDEEDKTILKDVAAENDLNILLLISSCGQNIRLIEQPAHKKLKSSYRGHPRAGKHTLYRNCGLTLDAEGRARLFVRKLGLVHGLLKTAWSSTISSSA